MHCRYKPPLGLLYISYVYLHPYAGSQTSSSPPRTLSLLIHQVRETFTYYIYRYFCPLKTVPHCTALCTSVKGCVPRFCSSVLRQSPSLSLASSSCFFFPFLLPKNNTEFTCVRRKKKGRRRRKNDNGIIVIVTCESKRGEEMRLEPNL